MSRRSRTPRCLHTVRREDLSVNDQAELSKFEDYIRVESARRNGADANACDMLITAIYPDIDSGQQSGGDA